MELRRMLARAAAVGSLLVGIAGCNSQPARPMAMANSAVTTDSATTTVTRPVVLEDEIRGDLYYLASDRLEGRGVGTQGLDIAADYIKTRFEAIGLKPLPELGGYFQQFEITEAQGIGDKTTLASGDRTYKLKDEFTAMSFSAEKEFAGPVVFVGYGITDAARKYDDYAGLDVKGKVVMAMRFEPHDAKGKSRWNPEGDYTTNAHLETKAKAAAEHGAAGLILVNPPTFHDQGDDPLVAFSRQFVGAVGVPVVQVKRAAADEMLARGGAGALKELQSKIDSTAAPASVALKDVEAKGAVAIKRTKTSVRNVVAYLPGAGPQANEYVVVGSHYDHLGWGGMGSLMNMPSSAANPHAATKPTTAPVITRALHHGADDNASGTSAMLDLARIFAHRKTPPARSIVFCAFTAEEMGLIGSNRFVSKPPIDLKRTAAMLNLDMVGRVRNHMLYVGGGGTAEPLKEILKAADARSPLEFKNFGEGGLGPSDHMSFAVKKVPVIFLFSGNHEDYHRPTDTADKVNFDGIAEVVEMSVGLVDDLAHMNLSKYVDAADKNSMLSPMTAGTGGEGTRRASLGVVPEYGGEEDGKGVKIGGTTEGTAAAKAGLQAGDVVLKLGDQATGTLMELSTALGAHKPGDKVKLIYRRDGKDVTVEVTLGERRG